MLPVLVPVLIFMVFNTPNVKVYKSKWIRVSIPVRQDAPYYSNYR
tara:strand:+ start:4922 stop:5056 length:135 start_codon:yes stop_codon:yes gene_type:complete